MRNCKSIRRFPLSRFPVGARRASNRVFGALINERAIATRLHLTNRTSPTVWGAFSDSATRDTIEHRFGLARVEPFYDAEISPTALREIISRRSTFSSADNSVCK